MYKVWHLSLKNISSVFFSHLEALKILQKIHSNIEYNLRKTSMAAIFLDSWAKRYFFPINHLRKKDVNELCS